jgi:prefoldin subunit 5
MKKISFFLPLIILFGLMSQLTAQNPVAGRYKGHMVKMRYVSGNTRDDIEYLEYDGVELTKKISDLNSQIADLNNQIKSLKSQTPKPPKKDSAPKTDTAQERRLWELEGENHRYRSQVDSLEKQVVLLKDSVRFFKESLRKVNHELDSLSRIVSERSGDNVLVDNYSQSGSHIGVYCSLGSPWLMNDLLSPKKGEIPIWSRQMTFSHQIGIFWGSRSLLQNGSLSLGVGLEYSCMRFAAGMGQNTYTLDSVFDNDNDLYTAHLTYRNVVERATLHCLSIPLTLSLGQPHSDRVSGYVQFTLAPSFCVASSLSAEGYYDLEGTYSQWNLTLSEFQPLGFGYNNRIEAEVEKTDVSWFLLTGRIAGGVYVPLCRLSQGKTSPWVMKFGVKLDYSIIPNIPKAKNDDSPTQDVFNATDYITQNNFLSRRVSQFLNPGVEVGIMYILGN